MGLNGLGQGFSEGGIGLDRRIGRLPQGGRRRLEQVRNLAARILDPLRQAAKQVEPGHAPDHPFGGRQAAQGLDAFAQHRQVAHQVRPLSPRHPRPAGRHGRQPLVQLQRQGVAPGLRRQDQPQATLQDRVRIGRLHQQIAQSIRPQPGQIDGVQAFRRGGSSGHRASFFTSLSNPPNTAVENHGQERNRRRRTSFPAS